jgi:hypothetical protein
MNRKRGKKLQLVNCGTADQQSIRFAVPSIVFTANMTAVCIHLHVVSKLNGIHEGMKITRHERWPSFLENHKVTIAEMSGGVTTELSSFLIIILRHANVATL